MFFSIDQSIAVGRRLDLRQLLDAAQHIQPGGGHVEHLLAARRGNGADRLRRVPPGRHDVNVHQPAALRLVQSQATYGDLDHRALLQDDVDRQPRRQHRAAQPLP